MSRFAIAAFLALVLVVLLIPAANRAAEPARIEPVVVETAQGRFTFTAEIADTPELRQRGLMFRHNVPEERAMLFDWGRVAPVSMWMRNTYVSLDMIFIAADGRVAKVAEATEPLSDATISSGEPVAAVLEVVAGTAQRIGLKPGDRVRHPMFASP
ncbi:MAG TPA: DUF192 domain-containing protein [Aestuariivirgaceae bacterium]|nr:DUF192 domain-containing protein [Aestuariivirgaceae bacterium]